MKSMRSDVASACTTASLACKRARPDEEVVRTEEAEVIGIDRGAEEFARRELEV